MAAVKQRKDGGETAAGYEKHTKKGKRLEKQFLFSFIFSVQIV